MCKFFKPDLDRWLLPSDRINPILNLNLKEPSVSAIEIQLTTHIWNLKPQQSRNPKQSFNSKWNYRLQSPKHFQHSTLNQLPPNFLFNFATAVNIAFKIRFKPIDSNNLNQILPKQLTNPMRSSYISKAVKGNNFGRDAKAAHRVNPDILNLDNYIVWKPIQPR